MSAIVTDQIRILNARNFVNEISSGANSYYSFVGLTNPEDYSATWDDSPLAPRDSLNDENHTWDTIIGLKKIATSDIRFAVRKTTWSSGITYDMYRHNISRDNLSQPSLATSLYAANYFVMNKDFRVYICLQNGSDPENPNGRPSLDEPTFVDLEPRSAGTSGDGYIWKYLYTIDSADIIKFDSLNYITVPTDWETKGEYQSVRLNAENSTQLKVAKIVSRGVDVGPANQVYTCSIIGDGTGGEATIIINNQSKVDSVIISNGGSGYTFAKIDLTTGGFPQNYTTAPEFEVIIPPRGGHGADIYRELGTTKILLYSRVDNVPTNPDFITGNKISRIGVIKNPLAIDSDEVLQASQVSALYALKLIGTNDYNAYINADFPANGTITQTVSTGVTAVGRVISYDKNTGILKYWQDRTLYGYDTSLEQTAAEGIYGNKVYQFSSNIGSGGSLEIIGANKNLKIDSSFDGTTFIINNLKYYLGQTFDNGVAPPEVEKYSGDLIYVDNRPSITRSVNQREDIKIVLQF
jgi:hypothetical protein